MPLSLLKQVTVSEDNTLLICICLIIIVPYSDQPGPQVGKKPQQVPETSGGTDTTPSSPVKRNRTLSTADASHQPKKKKSVAIANTTSPAETLKSGESHSRSDKPSTRSRSSGKKASSTRVDPNQPSQWEG